MTETVVDASVAASWLLPDERDPQADALLAGLEAARGIVPRLWHYEVRNVLLVAHRRGRLSAKGMTERVAGLSALPLDTDDEPDLGEALALAAKHGLSFYDGLYLELACRRHARIATLDRRLGDAARTEGVAVLD
jgi:predicted nucleic acid-binding protein